MVLEVVFKDGAPSVGEAAVVEVQVLVVLAWRILSRVLGTHQLAAHLVTQVE